MRTALCPACDWKTRVEKNVIGDVVYFFVKCRDCGLSQKRDRYVREEDAVAAWNESCRSLRES